VINSATSNYIYLTKKNNEIKATTLGPQQETAAEKETKNTRRNYAQFDTECHCIRKKIQLLARQNR